MKGTITMLLLLFAVTPYLAQGRLSESPAVVSAVAPVYPAIALAAHGSGDVIVVADINKAGEVTMARVRSGHNLLQSVSIEAARRWKFSPGTEDHRQAELTFTFRIVPDKTAANDRTAVFYPPYRIEVCNDRVVTTTNY